MFMQNELEELYNMLVSETDVMKNVDVEKIGGIALIPVENIQDAILRVGKN